MSSSRVPAALRAIVLLVVSLVLLGTSAIQAAGRPSALPGVGASAAGLLPAAVEDTRTSLAVLRAALATAGAQTAAAAALPPVAGPVVAAPATPAPRDELRDQSVARLGNGPRDSRAPPLTTGT